jgi:hypothetical protein
MRFLPESPCIAFIICRGDVHWLSAFTPALHACTRTDCDLDRKSFLTSSPRTVVAKNSSHINIFQPLMSGINLVSSHKSFMIGKKMLLSHVFDGHTRTRRFVPFMREQGTLRSGSSHL